MSDPEEVKKDILVNKNNPYGELCPICGSPANSRCRCPNGEFSCKNNHSWWTCRICKNVVSYDE